MRDRSEPAYDRGRSSALGGDAEALAACSREVADILANFPNTSLDQTGVADTEETQAVLDHHYAAFAAGDLDEIMADFTEDSVVITSIRPVEQPGSGGAVLEGSLVLGGELPVPHDQHRSHGHHREALLGEELLL
jgi:hypothetical protein